jgi:DNA-binding transcriptional LysR family regulator
MRHLQSFKYVKLISESGSIRSAAESCAISPSALNRHIQSLELDIGFRIFDRLSVGVRLSIEGEIFYQFALSQLRSFERLQSQINDIKGMRTGVVRLGVSADLNVNFVNAQIAKYQNEYPYISFELKVIDQNNMEDYLTSNRLDIALFYQPIISRNLNILHAFEVNVHAALPLAVKTESLAKIKFYELIDHQILLPSKNTQLRNKIDSACSKLGITLRTQIECDDPFPHLTSSNNARVAFCLPLLDEFDQYNAKGYKLVPLASKELGVGYVNLVSPSQGIMAIAPQKFVESLIKEIERL